MGEMVTMLVLWLVVIGVMWFLLIDVYKRQGYYCTVDGDIKITEQFLADVAKRMRWLSDEKIPIKKKTIHTDDAIELFHRHGMYDKEKLFEYRRVSKVNIYSCLLYTSLSDVQAEDPTWEVLSPRLWEKN